MFRKWQHIRWQASQNEHPTLFSVCPRLHLLPLSSWQICAKQCTVLLEGHVQNVHIAAFTFFQNTNLRTGSKGDKCSIEIPPWEFQHLQMKVGGRKKYLRNSSAPELAMSKKYRGLCGNIIPVERVPTYKIPGSWMAISLLLSPHGVLVSAFYFYLFFVSPALNQ